MKSVFLNPTVAPTQSDLADALGSTHELWQALERFVVELVPNTHAAWKCTHAKTGWSYRISDSKRVLLYLLPRDGYFKAAFVFGQNATDTIFASSIDSYIQQELRAAKVYVEGRGIRIDVNDNTRMEDIKMLIRIKVGNI